MERINELEAYIGEYWEERTKAKKLFLSKNSAIMEITFRMKLNTLIDEQVRRQKTGQDKIKYLFLCNLISSSYTGSYEVMLGMSNSMLYLDERESHVYWYPALVYEGFDDDMQEVEKKLRRKFIRLGAHELFCLKQKLLYGEWQLVCDCFQRQVESSSYLLLESTLLLESECYVLTGEYMDQLQVVSRIETEGRIHI